MHNGRGLTRRQLKAAAAAVALVGAPRLTEAQGTPVATSGVDVISPGTVAPGEIDVLSLEQINAVADADIIIAPDFLPDQTAAQEANALFRALPAVQNGGYLLLSPEMAQALYIESALSMQWGVPRLVDAVIEGADGKGKKLD